MSDCMNEQASSALRQTSDETERHTHDGSSGTPIGDGSQTKTKQSLETMSEKIHFGNTIPTTSEEVEDDTHDDTHVGNPRTPIRNKDRTYGKLHYITFN